MDQLSIDGTLNFRSVATYRARNGRIRKDAIYRSGEFYLIGPGGIDALRGLGVTAVYDLRSDSEKSHRPSTLLTTPGFRVLGTAHDMRNGDLRAVLTDTLSTVESCAAVMTAIYAALPVQFAGIFRHYYLALLENTAPVAVHCAAGKDRTGVAVALLLDLLGVSRDDVFDDYLKTNAVRDRLFERFRGNANGFGGTLVAQHLVGPVVTADPAYLEAMFASVERDFGSTGAYARAVLGLDDRELDRLSRRLVA